MADGPEPTGPSTGARISRRRALALAATGCAVVATGLLAGCTGSEPGGADGPDDPDAPVRADVAAAEARLIARYDATMAAHPGLAGTLAVLRDQHAAHREAMGAPDPAGSPSAPASGSASPARVPRDPGRALAALAEAERTAAKARTRSCTAAADAGLVRTLALVAASEAAHAAVLAQAAP